MYLPIILELHYVRSARLTLIHFLYKYRVSFFLSYQETKYYEYVRLMLNYRNALCSLTCIIPLQLFLWIRKVFYCYFSAVHKKASYFCSLFYFTDLFTCVYKSLFLPLFYPHLEQDWTGVSACDDLSYVYVRVPGCICFVTPS